MAPIDNGPTTTNPFPSASAETPSFHIDVDAANATTSSTLLSDGDVISPSVGSNNAKNRKKREKKKAKAKAAGLSSAGVSEPATPTEGRSAANSEDEQEGAVAPAVVSKDADATVDPTTAPVHSLPEETITTAPIESDLNLAAPSSIPTSSLVEPVAAAVAIEEKSTATSTKDDEPITESTDDLLVAGEAPAEEESPVGLALAEEDKWEQPQHLEDVVVPAAVEEKEEAATSEELAAAPAAVEEEDKCEQPQHLEDVVVPSVVEEKEEAATSEELAAAPAAVEEEKWEQPEHLEDVVVPAAVEEKEEAATSEELVAAPAAVEEEKWEQPEHVEETSAAAEEEAASVPVTLVEESTPEVAATPAVVEPQVETASDAVAAPIQEIDHATTRDVNEPIREADPAVAAAATSAVEKDASVTEEEQKALAFDDEARSKAQEAVAAEDKAEDNSHIIAAASASAAAVGLATAGLVAASSSSPAALPKEEEASVSVTADIKEKEKVAMTTDDAKVSTIRYAPSPSPSPITPLPIPGAPSDPVSVKLDHRSDGGKYILWGIAALVLTTFVW